ncbi:MAG: tetratricopeptide repeat protein, partial [Cytophagaceae bacterium]
MRVFFVFLFLFVIGYLQAQSPVGQEIDMPDTFSSQVSDRTFNVREKKLLLLEHKKQELEEKKQSDTSYIHVLAQIARLTYEKGNYEKAKQDYLKLLYEIKKYVGEKDRLYLKYLYPAAVIFMKSGNYIVAERILLRMEELSRQVSGKASREYALALNGLGMINQVKGELLAAETYLHLAGDLFEKNRKQEGMVGFADNLGHQGYFYFIKGSYTASEALYRQAISTFQYNELTQTEEFAQVLIYTGLLYSKLNNPSKAFDYLYRALMVQKELFSPKHPECARTQSYIAEILIQADYLLTASSLLNKSIRIQEEALSRKHHDYVYSVKLLADISKIRKEFPEAEQLYLSALDTFRLTMGERNMGYASMREDLAGLYFNMGRYEESAGLHFQNLELRKDLLDEMHPHYLKSLQELARVYWAMKNVNRAERFYKKNAVTSISQFKKHFAFLSEKEKGAYYEGVNKSFEEFNAFAIERSAKKPKILRDVYDTQLATKALLFNSTR